MLKKVVQELNPNINIVFSNLNPSRNTVYTKQKDSTSPEKKNIKIVYYYISCSDYDKGYLGDTNSMLKNVSNTTKMM